MFLKLTTKSTTTAHDKKPFLVCVEQIECVHPHTEGGCNIAMMGDPENSYHCYESYDVIEAALKTEQLVMLP